MEFEGSVRLVCISKESKARRLGGLKAIEQLSNWANNHD